MHLPLCADMVFGSTSQGCVCIIYTCIYDFLGGCIPSNKPRLVPLRSYPACFPQRGLILSPQKPREAPHHHPAKVPQTLERSYLASSTSFPADTASIGTLGGTLGKKTCWLGGYIGTRHICGLSKFGSVSLLGSIPELSSAPVHQTSQRSDD